MNAQFGSGRPDDPPPGLPPGLPSGLPPGLLWGFGFDREGRPEALDPELASAFSARSGGWVWLHFDLLDQRCHSWLSALHHLAPAARATLLSSGDHQHIRVAPDCLAGVIADVIRKLDGPAEELGHWRFAMSGTILISAGRHALQAIEAVRGEIGAGASVATPANLIEAILEEIAGDCEQRVRQLAADLDPVEDRILADEVHDERRPLARLRRRIVRLHRRIDNVLAMVRRLDHQAKAEPAVSVHAAVARVAQRLAESDHELRELQERGRLLQEEVATKLATEANSYLQGISVLTALLLPPTFIVGIYGMNVKDIPFGDDDTGFIWVMLLSIVSAIVAYWLMKRAPRLFKDSGLIR